MLAAPAGAPPVAVVVNPSAVDPIKAEIEDICKSGLFTKVTLPPIEDFLTVESGALIKALTIHLVETYQECVKDFKYSRKSAPQRVLTKITDPARHNGGYDNAEHDLICRVGDAIVNESKNKKYEILDWLGQGSFGQVIKIQSEGEEPLALKIIKNKQAYFRQAQLEIQVLMRLNKLDPDDRHRIIRMKEAFVFHKHLCVAFELLNMNLYDILKQNKHRGVSALSIRIVVMQILEALRCLRDAQIIHCDLKPENVMVQNDSPTMIKLIDFGSACLANATVHTYIQSRFYRSPEVLLGVPYTTAIDMWSLGCIAAELHLGLPIFPGSTEFDQIKRIVDTLGIPPSKVIEIGNKARRYFKKLDSVKDRATTIEVVDRNGILEAIAFKTWQGKEWQTIRWTRLPREWKSTDGPFGLQVTKDFVGDDCLGVEPYIVCAIIGFTRIVVEQRPAKDVTPPQRGPEKGDGPAVLLLELSTGKTIQIGQPPCACGQLKLKAKDDHHIIGLTWSEHAPLNIKLIEAPMPPHAIAAQTRPPTAVAAGAPEGLPPGAQPVAQPGVQPGVQLAVPPGVQPGMQPGVQPGHLATPPLQAKVAQENSTTDCSHDDEDEESSEASEIVANDSQPTRRKCRVSRARRRNPRWRFKTDHEYQVEELKKVGPCKKYFDFHDLESMIACVPARDNLNDAGKAQEQWWRQSFLQWLTGVLDLNPEERWTPRMALQHPMLQGAHVQHSRNGQTSPPPVFDPDFKPVRETCESALTANYESSGRAPSAPSMTYTSEGSPVNSAVSSSAGSSHGGPGMQSAGKKIPEQLRHARATDRQRKERERQYMSEHDAPPSVGTGGTSQAPPSRGPPCGSACGGGGDASPWHPPSPMSNQSTGTASERIPSSSFSGTESGGEVFSRASVSHSDTSGRPWPHSAHLSDSDNASAGAEQAGPSSKDKGNWFADRLVTILPSRIENNSPRGVPFREALGLRKSGPVVADRAVPGSNQSAASAEDQGHGRFAPPGRGGSGFSAGSSGVGHAGSRTDGAGH